MHLYENIRWKYESYGTYRIKFEEVLAACVLRIRSSGREEWRGSFVGRVGYPGLANWLASLVNQLASPGRGMVVHYHRHEKILNLFIIII